MPLKNVAKKVIKTRVKRVRKKKHPVGSEYTRYWKSFSDMASSLKKKYNKQMEKMGDKVRERFIQKQVNEAFPPYLYNSTKAQHGEKVAQEMRNQTEKEIRQLFGGGGFKN